MKKNILLAVLLCCTFLSAYADKPQNINGTSYFLPKTGLKFTILTEKTTYTPGEFSQYAERYLKQPAGNQPETTYRILGIRLSTYGIADTSKLFTASIDSKHNIMSIYKDDNGVLLAVNDRPNPPAPDNSFKPAPKPARLNPNDFLSQDILSAGSKAKMAELAADEIYDIRDSRTQLTRGQADNMPTDGQQMRIMLNSLNTQEAALVQMFNGITDKDTLEIPVEFVPDKEVEKEVLFRFSKYFGIVDADDLSGVPYYITVVNQHNVPVNTTTVGKDEKIKDDAGIWVNLPGKISVKLYQGEKLLENFETYVAQFGRTEPMMGELFSKKMETKVRLNPATGNADSINTELRK